MPNFPLPSTIQGNVTTTGWVPEPNCGRSTVSILWACLTAVLFCVYVTLHLDVPARPLKWHETLRRKLFWVVVGLGFPELICAVALEDFLAARDLINRASEFHKHLTAQQAFFIHAGGFAFRWSNEDHTQGQNEAPVALLAKNVALIGPTSINIIHANIPGNEAIADHSKMDACAKVVAIAQALKVLAEVVSRLSQHLTVSLLEVSTVAYLVMASATYFSWFNKPYDVMMMTFAEPTAKEKEHLLGEHLQGNKHWDIQKHNADIKVMSIVWDALPLYRPRVRAISLMLVSCAIFGGILSAAWKSDFPSQTEAWLWRACSIACVVLLPAIFGLSMLIQAEKEPRAVARVFHIPLIVLYFACRLFIIVECFLSFRRAPVSIYRQVPWTFYVQFFGN